MEAIFIKSATQSNQFPSSDKPEIAFAGKSNVGKSSLLNRLVNYKKLARTSSEPGRTQAINFFSVGKSLCLADLPGYGYAKVPLAVRKGWKKLVDTYLKKRVNLKAVVVILDIRRDLGEKDLDLLNWLKEYQIGTIIVFTKMDKLSKSAAKRKLDLLSDQIAVENLNKPIGFSSKTGQGRQELWKKINETIKS